MGSVKIDIHKRDREWKNVNFSDEVAIKGLLKYRLKFDLTYKRDNNSLLTSDVDLSEFSEEILCLYIDLDILIKRCNFNDKQNIVLNLYMDGYIEEDIAEVLNVKYQTVNGIIKSICKKIKKENDRLWLTNNMLWNYKRIDVNYKQCSKCGEWLLKENYFSPDNTKKDGFKYLCKKCENIRKKC